MNEKFATELLHEVKSNAKRWFIAFCIMVVLEVVTIIGFIWYITLPIEEATTTEQTVEDIDSPIIPLSFPSFTSLISVIPSGIIKNVLS